MPEPTDPSDETIEETNLQLNDGLETCRSVVNDYRALILGVGTAAKTSGQRPNKDPTTPDPSE